MIDFARISVIAGSGGEGAGSFVHIKGKRRGKADGGDGGVGGNVYFVATASLNTLEAFRYVKEYKAQSGARGLSNRRKGAQGADLQIKVPLGTQIVVTDVNGKPQDVHDLVEEGQSILIARGGEPGRGNAHLRDEFGRRPFGGEKGMAGEIVSLTLELKLIADVGLVGLPNAGKSTLIAALTSARPKIADYPFTTLEPNLGILKVQGKNIVIADIPGLIEGASTGKGLGDKFLRHIERTKIIIHLVDASQVGDLWEKYQTIRGELKAYSKELSKKKEIIVLNKSDLVDEDTLKAAVEVFAGHRKKPLVVSARESLGIELLIKEIGKRTKPKAKVTE